MCGSTGALLHREVACCVGHSFARSKSTGGPQFKHDSSHVTMTRIAGGPCNTACSWHQPWFLIASDVAACPCSRAYTSSSRRRLCLQPACAAHGQRRHGAWCSTQAAVWRHIEPAARPHDCAHGKARGLSNRHLHASVSLLCIHLCDSCLHAAALCTALGLGVACMLCSQDTVPCVLCVFAGGDRCGG